MRKIYIIKLIIFLSLSTLINNCQNADPICNKKSISIMAFIDTYHKEKPLDDYLRQTYENYLKPSLIQYCKQNKATPAFELELIIYPIDGNSENAAPLGALTIGKKECKGIYNYRDNLDDYFNTFENEFYDNVKNYQNKDQRIRILPTIPVMAEKVRNIKTNESNRDIFVVYISDMIELYNPARPENGFFTFLEKGNNKIDEYSLKYAINQLNDKKSWINYNIIAPTERMDLPDMKFLIFRPKNLNAETNTNGVGFNQIKKFWYSLGDSLNFKFEIYSIKEMKYKLDLIDCK